MPENYVLAFFSDLIFEKGKCGFTLVSCDGCNVFSRRRQAEDPPVVDASFCLHVVLEGAVNSSWQTGHVLRLKHQLGRQQKFKSIHLILDAPQQETQHRSAPLNSLCGSNSKGDKLADVFLWRLPNAASPVFTKQRSIANRCSGGGSDQYLHFWHGDRNGLRVNGEMDALLHSGGEALRLICALAAIPPWTSAERFRSSQTSENLRNVTVPTLIQVSPGCDWRESPNAALLFWWETHYSQACLRSRLKQMGQTLKRVRMLRYKLQRS